MKKFLNKMNSCIFCKIVNKEVPAEILYEDDEIIAFNDVHPIAPVHILIIPKKHIDSVNSLEIGDASLMGTVILVAKKLAQDKGIAKDGYKLLFRVGEHGGQEIPHVHIHLIGGAQLQEDIKPI